MKRQIGYAAFLIVAAINAIAGCSQSSSGSNITADDFNTLCDPPVEQIRFDGQETEAITKRLKEMFDEDQSAREPGKEDWVMMAQNDRQHRIEVLGYLQMGQVIKPESLYYAALVFQHGNCLDHYGLARDLAERSMEGGHDRAGWLYAAAVDRYLVKTAQLQKYGTQQCRDGQGVGHVCPVDPQTTDEERSQLGVPPLKELEAIANTMNTERPANDEPPVALPPIDPETKKIIALTSDEFYRAKNGWIVLMLDGKYAEAADLINLHLIYQAGENLNGLGKDMLELQAGELYAFARQDEKALELLGKAQQTYSRASPTQEIYIGCIIAFIKHDQNGLRSLRDSLERKAVSEFDQILLQKTDNLIANYGQPYLDASMGQTKYLMWALAFIRNPFYQFFFLLLLNVMVGMRLGLFSYRDAGPGGNEHTQAAETPASIERRYPIVQSIVWAALALVIILLEFILPDDYPHDHVVTIGLPLFITAAIVLQGITAMSSGLLPKIKIPGLGYRYKKETSYRRKGIVRIISGIGLLILTTVFLWASYIEVLSSTM